MTGQLKSPQSVDHDKWKTLSVSILDQYQSFSKFGEGITYFRLIPNFVHELEHQDFSDVGIGRALAQVLNVSPVLTDRGFDVPLEGDEIRKISQVNLLLNFANALRNLARRAEDNHRQKALVDAVETVTHDFRKPFSLFMMMLSAIKRAGDQANVHLLAEQMLPTIEKISADVGKLMDEVRDATRPVESCLESVEPNSLVEESLTWLKQSRQGAEITTDFRSSARLTADPKKLKRVIENILENAADATESGKIWIKTRDVDHGDQPRSIITIGNDSYIPAPERQRLFEKYYSKGKEHGTGLGLYICRKIAAEHNGSIECRSSRRGGTEFDIVLPRG